MEENIKIEPKTGETKFIVTRTIIEEMGGTQLLKVIEEIQKSIDKSDGDLKMFPKQIKAREEALTKDMEMLNLRVKEFNRWKDKAKMWKVIEDRENERKPKTKVEQKQEPPAEPPKTA